MATPQQNLQTAYENACQRLAEYTATAKPTYSEEGKSWQWGSYYDSLVERILELEGALQRAGGPFEVRSQGVPG